jgi:hypothetical protein
MKFEKKGEDQMIRNIIILVIAIFIVLPITVQSQEAKEKPKPCEFTGVLKNKSDDPKRITIDAVDIQKEFSFIGEDKKECLSWPELVIGNNVRVICKEKKERLEATCVQKLQTGGTMTGTGSGSFR